MTSTILRFSFLTLSVFALSCSGCGKKSKDLDWSNKTLESKTIKLGDLEITMMLPKDIKEDSTLTSARSIKWEAAQGSPFSQPSFAINKQGALAPKTVEGAQKEVEQMDKSVKVSEKETTESGFFVVAKSADSKTVKLQQWYRGGKETIRCSASQASSDGIPNVDGTIALFKKICESVKLPEGFAGPALSAEMKAFMAGLGSSDKVAAALAKYGKPGLQTADMEMYDLKSPAVVGSSMMGSATCYQMQAKAGVTTRTYKLCWENAKITQVKSLGMR